MEMGKSRWPTRYYPRSNRECCVWQIATSMGMIFGKRPATQAPICSGESKRICVCLRSEEHTSELQSPMYLVCRLLLEKNKATAEEQVARGFPCNGALGNGDLPRR